MKRMTKYSGKLMVLSVVMAWVLGGMLPVHAADPVVIGAVQPMSGWASMDGLNVVAGLKIGVERINSEGGVLGGRPLKLII